MENPYTPLTQNQKLLWTGQELSPESPMYNMVMAYTLNESISVKHFKEAFDKLVETSDVLRSVFEVVDGVPLQKYLNRIDYSLDYLDFSNQENPIKYYKDWEQHRVTIHFNLNQCLFDCALVKLDEKNYIWYINQHHLITDGYSTTVLFSRMAKLYKHALEGKLHEIIDFPSFKNFIKFSDSIAKEAEQNETAKYWKEKQDLLEAKPDLYYNKTNFLHTESKRWLVDLGKERTEKIKKLANTDGIRGWSADLSLFNIFLTSLYAFIYRVSDKERLIIGSPTHNRVNKAFRNTMGFFVESFPLIVQIDDKETFLSLIKKVQLECNGFLKNAHIGQSTAEMSRAYNVFFNYINAGNPKFYNEMANTNWVHPGHMDPRHHLRLHVHDFDNTGSIKLYFDINTVIFPQALQERIPQHFLNVLDAFIENHSQKINAVSLITPEEVNQIASWNNTLIDYPQQETILSKFEDQVKRTPKQTALIYKESSLSYKALDDASNQVAHFLVDQGVKMNDIVVVSLERSLEMMVYIYGILKAGAAYLPIDTDIPDERLTYILKDSRAKILFYNHNNINQSNLNRINSFDVRIIKGTIDSIPNTKVLNKLANNDLAYVIYTSGSTGQPKGVKCHHKGICNRLNWMCSDYPISQKDIIIQKTPITFDVSLVELFWPLQVGATLVISEPYGHMDPNGLITSIIKHEITNIHFVPSLLNIFIDTKGVESCKSLKRIFCSGEALSAPIVQKVFDKLDVEVHNLYGPTEASVEVTKWQCKKDDLTNGIPIGKPVANTKLYILDENLNQLPIGLIGELYIAGAQVANGYLNKEDLTHERFVDNIFTESITNKMYKTGDLARYRPDGAIEYHGRKDSQVKLRGLRIELGEIEKNIEKIEGVSQAVVIVSNNEELVAYYTGQNLTDDFFVSRLRTFLPDYMIPQFYIHIEQFELLSSGKINRNKLPEFSKNEEQTGEYNPVPKTEIEQIVFNVWKDVLGIKAFGINENFIRVGGNSLDAILITSRLKSILDLDVSITDVFNYPTIATYSDNVEKTITKLLNE